MRLLVSVRSLEEVPRALSGGADIIDAKEPMHGSLGPVAPLVLGAILHRVPANQEVSVALGDFSDPDAARLAIAALPLPVRLAPIYLKLGFAGVSSAERVKCILEAGVGAIRAHFASAPRLIAVAYADSELASTVPVDEVWPAAAAANAAGVLLDTHSKGLGDLFNWIGPERLGRLIAACRGANLLTAVAGGLGLDQVDAVARAQPDVVGFRSAACVGGRNGLVSRVKVARLRRAVRGSACLR
jgi:(5-formylfuran-3-yl)methyl phosphate synthase